MLKKHQLSNSSENLIDKKSSETDRQSCVIKVQKSGFFSVKCLYELIVILMPLPHCTSQNLLFYLQSLLARANSSRSY